MASSSMRLKPTPAAGVNARAARRRIGAFAGVQGVRTPSASAANAHWSARSAISLSVGR